MRDCKILIFLRPVESYIRHEDFLRPSSFSVMLRGPPLISEMGWTGEHKAKKYLKFPYIRFFLLQIKVAFLNVGIRFLEQV